MNDETLEMENSDIDMESLVHELASLQAERNSEEAKANEASALTDASIADVKDELVDLTIARKMEREPYEIAVGGLDVEIDCLKADILALWDGEKRTVRYPGGLLKMRTLKSVDIGDGAALLAELIQHFTTNRIAEEFISGFNKKAVRKFIDLHPQPPDVVKLVPNTTVKLEVE